MNIKLLLIFLMGSLVDGVTQVYADGNPVDKVYHPFVVANERKVEWRFASRQTDNKNVLAQRFAYGQALSENLIVEAYISAQRDETDDFGLQGYELEVRYMLTEQGQLWADWGLLFEFEKQHDEGNHEITAGLLFEKEFVHTSLTINALIVYEWGASINSEMEKEFRLQYRYRFMPEVQPAIEIYTGENFFGIGPAFMGMHRYSGIKQLKWEVAGIAGFNGNKTDRTLRFAIEYQF